MRAFDQTAFAVSENVRRPLTGLSHQLDCLVTSTESVGPQALRNPSQNI